MATIGRILFNVTGIMSNKNIVKNSRKIGEAICDTMKATDGVITSQQIKEIITNTIGKKGASRIKIIDSVDDVKKYITENGGCSLEEFDATYKEILGCAASSKYKMEAMLHIKPKELIPPEIPEELLRPDTFANAITHETQHAISFSSGKNNLIKKLNKLPFIRKYIDKINLRQKNLGIQTIYTDLQLAALQIDTFDLAKSKELVQKTLTKGDDKNNIFIIKNLIELYKDEVRSYNVGFDAQAKYLDFNLDEPKNQIIDIFKNLIEALKQEKRNIRKHQTKSFFGLN